MPAPTNRTVRLAGVVAVSGLTASVRIGPGSDLHQFLHRFMVLRMSLGLDGSKADHPKARSTSHIPLTTQFAALSRWLQRVGIPLGAFGERDISLSPTTASDPLQESPRAPGSDRTKAG